MSISISSIQAAKEQLNEAIIIFFNEGSDVAVHSLVANSHEILKKELHLKEPKSLVLLEEILRRVEGETKEKLAGFMVKAKNVFKHANPGQKVKFASEINQIWIWDACLMYQKITGKISREMMCFTIWLYTNEPEYLNEPYKSLFKPYQMRKDMTKKEYIELMYEIDLPSDIIES